RPATTSPDGSPRARAGETPPGSSSATSPATSIDSYNRRAVDDLTSHRSMIPAHWPSRGHHPRSNANHRSQSAFSDPFCLGTSRLITGASNGNRSLRDPLGRKSSSLLSSMPSEVGLNVYMIVRSGLPLASNTSRDGRSYVVIVTSEDAPPLTIQKRHPN